MIVGFGGTGLVGLCLCLAAAAVLLVTAALRANRREGAAAEPAVQYVLDISPRMMLPAAGGEGTRLAAAQAVLAEVVRPSDPALTSGFRVFGAEADDASCRGTRLLVPMARANQSQIAETIASVEAGTSPEAPLAEAMVAAIRDLARSRGPHTLVVVTGGADSCSAQAAALVAQEAEKAGVRVRQFVIGFQVSAEDAEAIKAMIASASGAAYYDAPDATALRQLLETAQQALTRPFTGPVAAGAAGSGPGVSVGDYASQTACDHPYFPLRPGATWTYSGSGGPTTWRVNGVSGDLSSAIASVTISFEGGSLDYDWACSTQGVTYFQLGSIAPMEGMTMSFDVFNESGQSLLPADQLLPGAAWRSGYTMQLAFTTAGTTVTSATEVSEAHSVVDRSTLSTSLGTFDVITITSSSAFTTTPAGGGSPITSSGVSTITYAYGVGFIQGESAFGDVSGTTALVSYRVP